MREHELPVAADPVAAVDRLAVEVGLVIRLRTTLATIPDSVHWHLARDGQSGTLEVTWDPKAGRLWCKVHARRDAAWIDEAIAQLANKIASS